MLENYTNEHFASMQNDMDFLLEQRQEVVNIINRGLDENLELLDQFNLLWPKG